MSVQSRNETAWRKSRKFGDVYGGRRWPKIANHIFKRAHSLTPPAPGQETPILIEDNPSRDFFFPLSGAEVLETLNQLPPDQVAGITHVWLRRLKQSDYECKQKAFAEYIFGSGVRLIVLYPWSTDLLLGLGKRKPATKKIRQYASWTEDLVYQDDEWVLRWTKESLRRFYVEGLLLHEVGHHVDKYLSRWTKANKKQVEDFADQYAALWSKDLKQVFDAQANEDNS
jgi:hypothetical protein